MTRADNLREKLKQRNSNFSIREITTILQHRGFEFRDGKHRNFYHPDHPELGGSIPRSKELKGVYPKLVRKWLSELDDRERRADGEGR